VRDISAWANRFLARAAVDSWSGVLVHKNHQANINIIMPVQHIANLTEFKTLLASEGLVVVDFSAEWCTFLRY
jgi:thiol:disulfide interchange protein